MTSKNPWVPSAKRSATPLEALAWFITSRPADRGFCIAYSGGVDSHVLLHALACLRRADPQLKLRAVHVDHGLQAASVGWAAHCESVCASLNVALLVRSVRVVEGGEGPEGDARRARYAVFRSIVQPGEHLLLAQHADDQAETFLLQALRGSGPDGLAGMPVQRVLGSGLLCRPLLDCTQASLQRYAVEHRLKWVEDPSNQDTRFDRNYLRQVVMPALRARWPAAAQTLGRAAQRSGGASHTLLTLARDDLDKARAPAPDRLTGRRLLLIAALRKLPRERAFNALRLWVRQHGMPMPRLQDLVEVMGSLVHAGKDTGGIVNLRVYEFRRHAGHLHLLEPVVPVSRYAHQWHAPFQPMMVPEAGIELTCEAARAQSLQLPADGILTVRGRVGSESVLLGDPPRHRSLKNVWQEAGVPPWQRDAVPLLFCGDELVAIWGLVTAVNWRV